LKVVFEDDGGSVIVLSSFRHRCYIVLPSFRHRRRHRSPSTKPCKPPLWRGWLCLYPPPKKARPGASWRFF